MGKKQIITNAMRLLSQAGIAYGTMEYEVDENDLSGVHLAKANNLNQDQVFKTLVAIGEKNGIMVFCIPVADELDMKKCAILTKDKKVDLIPMKDLLNTTGYIRGGCSPIGMKKKYPTYIDETAVLFEQIYVSGGQRGTQIIIAPEALAEYVGAEFAKLTV